MNRRNADWEISLFGEAISMMPTGVTTGPYNLQPGDPEANIGLAKLLMAMDQPQKAEPLLRTRSKWTPPALWLTSA